MIQPCLLGTTILRTQRASFPHTFRRYKSITAAIERGRRNTSQDQTFGDTRRTNDISEILHTPSRGGYQKSRSSKGDEISRYRDKRDVRERRFQKDNEFAEWRSKPRQTEGRLGERSSRKQSDPKSHDMRSHRTEGFDGFAERTSGSFRSGQMESRSRDTESEKAPESLPYATAASEFLYGYSSVLAAIKANRRKLYKLYIHNRGINHEGRDAIVQRARALRLSIQEVGDEYLRAFDKSSNGRPHNVSTSCVHH
jgi:21S rRNA (GM2251-2'-O)-methyltransferase